MAHLGGDEFVGYIHFKGPGHRWGEEPMDAADGRQPYPCQSSSTNHSKEPISHIESLHYASPRHATDSGLSRGLACFTGCAVTWSRAVGVKCRAGASQLLTEHKTVDMAANQRP